MTNTFWKKQEKKIIIHAGNMNAVESCVDRHARENPNKLAFVFQDEKGKQEKITYKELEEKVNKFANLLSKFGKNRRVFLFLPKIPEMYTGFLAVIKSGNIACPLFEAFQTQGLELRLERGDADILVTNSELLKRLKHKRKMKIINIDSLEFKKQIKKQKEEFKPVIKNKQETMLMIFTSSTAGTPVAGIEIPHYALVQQHYTAEQVLQLNSEENYWCTAHPAWITGAVYGILAPLSVGCTTFILEGRFQENIWINFLKENKISILYTAPTALKMLREKIKNHDLEKVKEIFSVGEALPWSLVEDYKDKGKFIIDTYWQTETGSIIIANIDKIPRSIGKPIAVNAKIKDEMIVIEKSWPSMMTGIYKHNKMYKSYFSGKLFKTNDRAIQKGKYFYFQGRKDDIIKTSGERVSPLEIENILLKHKSVKESAVIGIPDKTRGSIIKAFIVLQDNVTSSEQLKQEISDFVKNNYAGHSYPKVIEFIKELPKGNSGKIIRSELK